MRPDDVGVRARDAPEVDHAALGDVEGVDAADVRLELATLVGSDTPDREAVLLPALEQALEPVALGLVDGDDELAAEWYGMSCSSANASSACRPSRQSRALRLPGA